MKHRDRIMGAMGTLLDNMRNLEAQLERHEKHYKKFNMDKKTADDETDLAFMADLELFRDQLVKFYYSWEERY